jgi:CxxC motif-containing protein (DUF1111 family)
MRVRYFSLLSLSVILASWNTPSQNAFAAPTDPGVRRAATDNGPPVPLAGLVQDELAFFEDGLGRFVTVEVVNGATQRQGNGLGPAFNSNQCSSCHSQPYFGGSSPAQNPLLQVANADGATNTIPWFEAANGPAREARFVQSNGVYSNYTVATGSPASVLSDIEAFANFMRMLAPPAPAPATASTANGRAEFISIGCAACHTPTLTTGKAIATGSARSPSPSLSNQPVNLFSDLVVHHTGAGLADGLTQGAAGPDEFRTAPLWGLGQRVYFLHDGRTSDLLAAIEAHQSPGSEASQVVRQFARLSAESQQDMLNFLRSL